MKSLSALTRAFCVLGVITAFGFSATKEVDLKRDIRTADTVVTGEVERTRSFYGSDGEIYTEVTLKVTGVLKQQQETPSTITFTVPGGEVGDVGVLFTQTPQFVANEPVLLFLKPDEQGVVQAAAKYELNAPLVADLKIQPVELMQRIHDELQEIGEPVREGEWTRAMTFARNAAVDIVKPNGDAVSIFNVGDATCYKLMGPKWRIPRVTYRLDASLPAGFPAAIQTAINTFNNVGLSTTFAVNPFSSNVINYGYIAAEGVLAQTRVQYQPATSTIVAFSLMFNRRFPWSTVGAGSSFDVEGVAAHEIGHAFGLDHPAPAMCNDQTMWFSAAPGETIKRTLEVGDRAGLAQLYDPPPPSAAPPPSTPPPSGPVVNPNAPPPTPVFSSLTLTGQLRTSSQIRLTVTGSNFVTDTVGLQIIVRGAGCPTTTGCVFNTNQLLNLTSTSAEALFVPRGGGAFTVTLRNTPYGAQSDSSYRFNVAIVVGR